MGTGRPGIGSLAEYETGMQPGHMWMPYFTGEHVSTDVALRDGKALWWRHTTGLAGVEGTFDYWTVHAEPMPAVEARILPWLEHNLAGFTGVINLETIDGAIIECHLRMAEQWLDLNGAGWLKAAVALYTSGGSPLIDKRPTGYNEGLFRAQCLPRPN